MKEFNDLSRNLSSVLTTIVQMRSLFQTQHCRQKVWRRYQTLQYGVHEAGVVLAILQTQVRVALLLGFFGEER